MQPPPQRLGMPGCSCPWLLGGAFPQARFESAHPAQSMKLAQPSDRMPQASGIGSEMPAAAVISTAKVRQVFGVQGPEPVEVAELAEDVAPPAPVEDPVAPPAPLVVVAPVVELEIAPPSPVVLELPPVPALPPPPHPALTAIKPTITVVRFEIFIVRPPVSSTLSTNGTHV